MGHDKGRRGTKRHGRPFSEDNGGAEEKRVTKVTPLRVTDRRASGIC